MTGNDRFGEIAVRLGFCTADQVARCLRIQSSTSEGLSLGNSLLREGYLTEAQYSRIVAVQRSEGRPTPRPGEIVPMPGASPVREEDLVGKLALREGLITEAQYQECLRDSQAASPGRTVGDLLVARRYLDPARAKDLQARVFRRRMTCGPCGASFTVLSVAKSKDVKCPRCKGPLKDEALPKEATGGDSFATGTLLKAISLPPKRPKP